MGGRGGKLQSHIGEHSNRGAVGEVESFQHRGPVPASTHQPKKLVCSPARCLGLGGEALASELGSQGEDWGRLREHILKGASAPQLGESVS